MFNLCSACADNLALWLNFVFRDQNDEFSHRQRSGFALGFCIDEVHLTSLRSQARF